MLKKSFIQATLTACNVIKFKAKKTTTTKKLPKLRITYPWKF